MLFHVRMDVRLPHDLGPAQRAEIVAREKEYSQRLQRAGKWPHIWRIAGEYANFSIFDVESNDELHDLLSGLPLFPYMDIRVTPLATHPSDINAGLRDRASDPDVSQWGAHGHVDRLRGEAQPLLAIAHDFGGVPGQPVSARRQ